MSYIFSFYLLHPSLLFIVLSLSLSHSPPLKDLDWSTVIPGNASTQAFAQCQCTGICVQLRFFSSGTSSSSLNLNWNLFLEMNTNCQQFVQLETKDTSRTDWANKSPCYSLLFFLTVAEEDCCLCVSAVEPLGIIREYCWARSWAQVSSGCCRWSPLADLLPVLFSNKESVAPIYSIALSPFYQHLFLFLTGSCPVFFLLLLHQVFNLSPAPFLHLCPFVHLH